MFRRRTRRGRWRRLQEFFWPSSGWRRSCRYMIHRIGRLPGTPYSIAAGFASGAAISFMPLVGLHFCLGALWAWLVRGNIVASMIGTAVGNPWTFPFIWVATYKFGSWLGIAPSHAELRNSAFAAGGHHGIDFPALFAAMVDASMRGDFAYLFHHIWPIWLPMFVGSLPFAILAWPAFFLSLKPVVAVYQHRRIARRMRQRQRDELDLREGIREQDRTGI